MKNLFLLLFVLLSSNLFSQVLNYNDLTDKRVKKHNSKGYTSYVSKDSLIFNAGDIIKVGVPSSDKSFAFITVLRGFIGDFKPLKKSYSGIDTKITAICITGNKKMGFRAIALCNGGNLWSFQIILENAIETNEIKTSLISSDDALSDLKKAKDKLDLGIITQEKYDSLKVECVKYIE